MHMSFRRGAIVITVGAYVSTWAATQIVGVPAVSAHSRSEAAIPTESLRISKAEAERSGEKGYYLEAYAAAPFVVLLEIGASCGPSCRGGMGYEYVYAWLPTKPVVLRARRSWTT